MNLNDFSIEELEAELNRRLLRCEVQDCNSEAIWEGWYKVRHAFNIPTGMIRKAVVCDNHKDYLGCK